MQGCYSELSRVFYIATSHLKSYFDNLCVLISLRISQLHLKLVYHCCPLCNRLLQSVHLSLHWKGTASVIARENVLCIQLPHEILLCWWVWFWRQVISTLWACCTALRFSSDSVICWLCCSSSCAASLRINCSCSLTRIFSSVQNGVQYRTLARTIL